MSCKGFAEQVQWLDVVIDLGSMLAHRVKLNEPREHKTNICEIYVLFGVGPECGAFAYSLRLAAISELAGGGCTREVLEAMILIGFTVFSPTTPDHSVNTPGQAFSSLCGKT